MAEATELIHQPVAAVRERWEARALRMATLFSRDAAAPRDKVGMCVLSILAHKFAIEDMQFLLRVCGFRGTTTPMLSSAAKIAKTSHIMANVISRDGNEYQNQSLFRDSKHMEGAFRRFADVLRMTDDERVDFFDAVQRWVVCDYRIDPNLDPADPDSKRLTVH